MDPAWLFMGALLALHLVEGLFWVRREALGFAKGARGHRVVRAEGPFGNHRGGLLMLSPLPPLGEFFVVEPWPLTLSASRVWLVPAETLGAPEAPPAEPGAWTWAEAGRTHREGKRLFGPGRRIVTTSSTVLAQALLEQLHAQAGLPEKARAAALRKGVQARHDVAAVQARLTHYRGVTRRLGVYGNLWLPLMFGGAYGLLFVPQVFVWAPQVLATLAGLLLLIWAEFFVAHRRLYPKLRGDRWLKLMLLVLSPPAASRARAWLARDALCGFHPLAVGAALLGDEAFVALAGPGWRDLHHPLGPDGPEAAEDLAEARARLVAAQARVLSKRGVDPQVLEAASAEREAEAQAHCPRCLAVYREPEGDCSDCPGVQKRVSQASAPVAEPDASHPA